MKGLFVPASGEQVCPGLLLNSTHRPPLNNPCVSHQNTRQLQGALRASQCLWMSRSLHAVAGMFLWVSCKALGKGPYLTCFSFVLLPFLCSCPWDTSTSFPSRYLLCSLRALLGTVSWLWQKCHPREGNFLGSSWDVLHLEMALSSVRKRLWLSSLELVYKS